MDFLTKVIKANEGEVPQYYVKGSHTAIIEPDEFDSVQAEIERRKNLGSQSVATVPSQRRLSAANAAVILVPRSGQATPNIAGLSGDAMKNTSTKNPARHRI